MLSDQLFDATDRALKFSKKPHPCSNGLVLSFQFCWGMFSTRSQRKLARKKNVLLKYLQQREKVAIRGISFWETTTSHVLIALLFTNAMCWNCMRKVFTTSFHSAVRRDFITHSVPCRDIGSYFLMALRLAPLEHCLLIYNNVHGILYEKTIQISERTLLSLVDGLKVRNISDLESNRKENLCLLSITHCSSFWRF